MKRKNLILFILLILSLFWSITIPKSRADLTNLWGVNNGDSRTYRIWEEMQGSASGVSAEYFIQYNIISVADADANNFTDVSISLVDFSTDPITVTLPTLTDVDPPGFPIDNDGTYVNDIIFDGQQDVFFLFLYVLIPNFYQLLLPITVNTTYGLNWTAALITINGSGAPYTDYTGYDQGNLALITYSEINTYDGTLDANYNLTGTIIWDKTTGWLGSLEYVRTYEETLGLSIWTSIKPVSPTSGAGIVTIRDITAWLGLAVGIAGLCFALYIYRKIGKEQSKEDEVD